MYNIEPTPEEHRNMRWWDNTKLVAVNTCPTYANLAYHQSKTLGHGGRALALEAGQICHEVFALLRLYDLLTYGPAFYTRRGVALDLSLVHARGVKLFSGERWEECIAQFGSADDEQTKLVRAALYLLNTSGYYDEASDRRRTLTNIEESCMVYIQNYPLNTYMPVVWGDFIGIEVPVDVLIETELQYDGQPWRARFVGKMDAICWDRMGKTIEVHENKTGARIDETWCAGYDMSHQVTGYCLAASAMLAKMGAYDKMVTHATMWGLCIPQPRTTSLGGFLRHPVSRNQHMFDAWLRWFQHTVDLGNVTFNTPPMLTQRYTHSCNRYFRPCGYIPFCLSEPDEAEAMLNEMNTREWNPLTEENSSG